MTIGGMPDLPEFEPDFQLLESATKERDYTEAAFNVLREVTQYCMVAASLVPAAGGWRGNDAVLCGLMVRLAKLLHGFLGYGAEDRRELVTILGRCAFETAVNLRFLLRFPTEQNFADYRRASLRHERQLRDEILANIHARGETLPIERRMLGSIDAAFRRAGLTPDEVEPRRGGNWAGKSVYGRAKEVELTKPYLAIFGGGSHAVHGNWQDLIDHHIEEEDGLYTPNPDFHRSRPQFFVAIGAIAIGAAHVYFTYRDSGYSDAIRQRLKTLEAHLLRINELHESYLRRVFPQYETPAEV